MYRIAVCDDEKIFAEQSVKLCREILSEEGIDYHIDVFLTPGVLLQEIAGGTEYQLLLLDILFKTDNGVDIATRLRSKGSRTSIIFISSSRDFALDGYRVQPISYLLKPLDKKLLRQAILLDYNQNYRTSSLFIQRNGTLEAVRLSDILYVEVQNRTLTLHTSKNNIEYQGTMRELEEGLQKAGFLRCHKSYMVNLSKVHDIKRYIFTLCSGDEVPIGKTFYQFSQKAFIDFLQER